MADRINENEEMESVTPENEEELNTDSVKTEDNNNDSETFNLSSDSEDEERISAENSDKNNGAENNEDADNDEDTASEDIDSGNINGDSYDEEGKELNVLELLNTVAKLEDTIVRLEAEKESLNNRHKRLQADFANYRKRTDREIGKVQSTVVVELIRELLPIIDNFERALAQDESESDFRKGIEMIYRQIITFLKKQGVEIIEAVGDEFDHNYHNAVAQVESDEHESGIVIEELQKGYILGETIIRPAMVKVAE